MSRQEAAQEYQRGQRNSTANLSYRLFGPGTSEAHKEAKQQLYTPLPF
jgi:hypothetical protein